MAAEQAGERRLSGTDVSGDSNEYFVFHSALNIEDSNEIRNENVEMISNTQSYCHQSNKKVGFFNITFLILTF